MTETLGSPRLFGTDGIRGPAGRYPFDRPTITGLGYHLAGMLDKTGRPPRVVMGGDTRHSTPEICRWLAEGLKAQGAQVMFTGVLPTPGVVYLARKLGADAGVVVSASHNPWQDNGIKLVDGDGFKWQRPAEARLEAAMEQPPAALIEEQSPLEPTPSLAERYREHLASVLPGERPLAGLSIVVDAANGAASALAASLFARLGAHVTSLFDQPDGRNINAECGSTVPAAMQQQTAAAGADLGIALDGDADRALVADESGHLHDGDALLYLWSRELQAAGDLEPPRIVATSMSNLGLERALARQGIGIVRCDVGDRVVVETMLREGLRLGGEQSGHLVDLGLSTTGDGLLTGLMAASVVARAQRPLSGLLAGFRKYPQVLVGVRVASKPPLESLPTVGRAVRFVEESLGQDGRLVLRYSGTEPLARVMIEGPDQPTIDSLAATLVDAIHDEIGSG